MENSNSTLSQDELTEDYFLDNYGTCKLENLCLCRRMGNWYGRECHNWVPLGVISIEELQATLKLKER